MPIRAVETSTTRRCLNGAYTVKKFLVQQGVPERDRTVALGETHLLTKDHVKQLVQSNPELTDKRERRSLRNITVIYLAQNRRVDITLANTGQQSVQLYPFNAHDAGTLLSEKAQAHAKKQPAAPKRSKPLIMEQAFTGLFQNSID